MFPQPHFYSPYQVACHDNPRPPLPFLLSCHFEANVLYLNAGGFHFPCLQLPLPLCRAVPLPERAAGCLCPDNPPRAPRLVMLDNYQVLETPTKSPTAGDTVTPACTFAYGPYLTHPLTIFCPGGPCQAAWPRGAVPSGGPGAGAVVSPLLTFWLLELHAAELRFSPSQACGSHMLFVLLPRLVQLAHFCALTPSSARAHRRAWRCPRQENKHGAPECR